MSTPPTPAYQQPPADALARLLKQEAARLGFIACGITTADPFPEAEAAMLAAIDAGYLAGMPWFTRERAHLACTPEELLPGARSLVVLAAPYRTSEPDVPDGAPRGRVARYAWGDDYHDTLKARLRDLVTFLERATGRDRIAHRVFVDSSPLAERAAAQRAGIGWWGKNTLILLPGYGSYAFLCALLLDVELPPDEPLRKSCGSCDLCLRACPTQAFPAPYVLDANRCISYLTIEHRGAAPDALRPLMGDHIFGCDICQQVCPVNRKGGPIGWPDFGPREETAHPRLDEWLTMDAPAYQRRFRGSPMKRAKLRGLKRNAAVAAGNSGDPALVSALTAALHDPEPLVRGHAAWALGRIGGTEAAAALTERLRVETEADVLTEIKSALTYAGNAGTEVQPSQFGPTQPLSLPPS